MKAVQGRKLWEKGKELQRHELRRDRYPQLRQPSRAGQYSVLAAVDEHGQELARGPVEGNTVEGFARYFGALAGE